MKKPNLPIIILCLAICVSGIAALSLKTFHTVNSTTSPYLLYLKVLQGNQQFYNVESGDYLDIHQLKETITSDNLPFSIQQFAIVDLTQNGIKDVVLQFSLAENNQAGFIILHDESGTIYYTYPRILNDVFCRIHIFWKITLRHVQHHIPILII